MKTKVTVNIGGNDYTVVTDKDKSAVQKAASLVDQNLTAIMLNSSYSRVDGAILAALNIADLYYSDRSSDDNLRAQIRSYADECASLRAELNKLKKEKRDR